MFEYQVNMIHMCVYLRDYTLHVGYLVHVHAQLYLQYNSHELDSLMHGDTINNPSAIILSTADMPAASLITIRDADKCLQSIHACQTCKLMGCTDMDKYTCSLIDIYHQIYSDRKSKNYFIPGANTHLISHLFTTRYVMLRV